MTEMASPPPYPMEGEREAYAARVTNSRLDSPPTTHVLKPCIIDNLMLRRPDVPVGGRLSLFLDFWMSLETNQWVISIVDQGYYMYILFQTIPQPTGIRKALLHGDYAHVLSEEVNILLQKGAIQPVPGDPSTGCYWTYFLISKKTGDL